MDVRQAIRDRVSVKEYAPRAVPRERIEALLELALQAPNHRMTRPVEFRVLGDRSRRAYAEALAGRKTARIDDPAAADAVREKVTRRTLAVPAMIGVVVAVAEDPEVREEDYATAFMAIQNLSLAAVETGLGTHIKTGAVMDEPALRTALEVGPAQRLAAIVFLGEPAEVPAPKPREPAADRTRWLD
ncbi:MAG TPA: nitroreductase family protein [Longimicrobiales bacterium]|nr:nitroreductase family protein [Longimicrobiales bacterium]